MISAVARRVGAISVVRASRPQAMTSLAAPVTLQTASFFGRLMETNKDGLIPDRNDTGRRQHEVDVAAFNRDPIFPPKGSGTKAVPIEVPSHYNERVVGFEHPETHAVYWFNMKAGKLHYVREIGMYFKLVPVPE